MKINIGLIDSLSITRKAITELFSANEKFNFIDIEDFENDFPGEIDVLIVSEDFKEFYNLDLFKNLKTSAPDIKGIFYSNYLNKLEALLAFRAGALGCLSKKLDYRLLFEAVATVSCGNYYFNRPITQEELQNEFRERIEFDTDLKRKLTIREIEILSLLGRGMCSKAIAELLFISSKTVENHRRNIREKLCLGTAPELIAYAARNYNQWQVDEAYVKNSFLIEFKNEGFPSLIK